MVFASGRWSGRKSDIGSAARQPITVQTTLLPWMGRIAYDGMLEPPIAFDDPMDSIDPNDESAVRDLEERYVFACA